LVFSTIFSFYVLIPYIYKPIFSFMGFIYVVYAMGPDNINPTNNYGSSSSANPATGSGVNPANGSGNNPYSSSGNNPSTGNVSSPATSGSGDPLSNLFNPVVPNNVVPFSPSGFYYITSSDKKFTYF
jgi:hypothetical protein